MLLSVRSLRGEVLIRDSEVEDRCRDKLFKQFLSGKEGGGTGAGERVCEMNGCREVKNEVVGEPLKKVND